MKRYHEWIEHNELGLALDELEMLREANEMNLTARAARYREKLVH